MHAVHHIEGEQSIIHISFVSSQHTFGVMALAEVEYPMMKAFADIRSDKRVIAISAKEWASTRRSAVKPGG